MRSLADLVLRAIEDESKKGFFPIIGPTKGQVSMQVVKQVNPPRVLEAGTFVGYSAILMAKHLSPNGKIITLEKDKRLAKMAMANIREAGLEDKIEVVIGDAKKTIKNVESELDILFLDAEKDEYLSYLKLAEPKLKKGSRVIADNVKIFAENMTDFLDYVRNSRNYQSQTFDFGQDAVEVSVRRFDI